MESSTISSGVGIVWRVLGVAGAVAVTVALAGAAGPRPAAEGVTGPPAGDDGAQALLWVDGVKNAYPRWSRDSSRVLYESDRSGRWQLFLMNEDGSHDRRITDGRFDDELPDWSPDNTSIAFVSDRAGNQDIYVMRADGSGLRRITRPPSPSSDGRPSVSPDGRRILFNRQVDETIGIFVIDLPGGDVAPSGTTQSVNDSIT